MGKIENLESYIKRCDDSVNGKVEKYDFLKEVFAVYGDEIGNIHEGLDMYSYHLEGESVDYAGDIMKIKAKLINYKDNLEQEVQNRKDEMELARLKHGNINVSANANNSNRINLRITLEQVMDVIQEISDDIITKEEREDLEDKVSGIDAALKSGRNDRVKEKIVGVLKFLMDKGADALIVMLPYLGQIASIINQL